MAEKRALKAAEEAKEAKANELIRRKAGKVRSEKKKLDPSPISNRGSRTFEQEAAHIKEDLKNKQMMKDIEAKRRGSSPLHSSTLPHPHSEPSLRLHHRRNVSYSYRKGERQEGPRCDQGEDRSRQARTRAKGGRGKGAPRGWHGRRRRRCHLFRSRRGCGCPSGVFDPRT